MDVSRESDVSVELDETQLTRELLDGFYGPAGHNEGWHHDFKRLLDDGASAVGYAAAVGEGVADCVIVVGRNGSRFCCWCCW